MKFYEAWEWLFDSVAIRLNGVHLLYMGELNEEDEQEDGIFVECPDDQLLNFRRKNNEIVVVEGNAVVLMDDDGNKHQLEPLFIRQFGEKL